MEQRRIKGEGLVENGERTKEERGGEGRETESKKE